ncbi:FmdE family protein [Candidatus Methanoperedens nitratireducens]|uniref:Putative Tungsten formylmethanofuran dehydrogenase, subunit E (FwdE) n=1 Tax=Candidatus Methanoperedens nitratireducens TaxID=1392998 RepID=A0A284VQY3_9EURY|nr:FmdE family protein [Candidatus Methanoperedens nitroreducens]SNQ61696.1 putative Tungsten formylmethanofuran dehydrogenase, subunit E (FwdE) [Candidatus Methanoperedens nitroreducens]
MDKKIVNLATELHGHLAPGIALGLRMSELALSRLSAKKGDKHLIGISETARCLADAMQAATGCTLGHGNAFIESYGKLAITIGDTRTKRGVRVALRDNAGNFSALMSKWMMRLGKLSHEEEDELSERLLDMDKQYFLIQDIIIEKSQNFDNSAIARCSACGEYIPENLVEKKNEGVYCKACSGNRYYKTL